MRMGPLASYFLLAVPLSAQLPDAIDPATAPKTWQADLRMMMRHGRMEPALKTTLGKIGEIAAKEGRRVKITKDREFAVLSTINGIIAFRRAVGDDGKFAKEFLYDSILLGVHGTGKEPPPWPSEIERQIGPYPLNSRASEALRNIHPLNVWQDTYFGRPCTVHEFGAGHWISRLYTRNDRVIAVSFGLEP